MSPLQLPFYDGNPDTLQYILEQIAQQFPVNAPNSAYPVVTSLPTGSSIPNGMVIHYLADATNGAVWTLKYRSASASAYKWEFVGGSTLYAEVVTREALNSATYVALATAGPSIALPLAGDYDVEIGCRPEGSNTTSDVIMSYDIGGTAASDNDAVRIFNANAGLIAPSVARPRRKTGLTAVTLTAKYREAAASATNVSERWMRLTPVRVG